jgi:hypothetical protein
MRRMTVILPTTILPGTLWRQLGVMLSVSLHAGRPSRPPFASFACFAVPPVSSHEPPSLTVGALLRAAVQQRLDPQGALGAFMGATRASRTVEAPHESAFRQTNPTSHRAGCRLQGSHSLRPQPASSQVVSFAAPPLEHAIVPNEANSTWPSALGRRFSQPAWHWRWRSACPFPRRFLRGFPPAPRTRHLSKRSQLGLAACARLYAQGINLQYLMTKNFGPIICSYCPCRLLISENQRAYWEVCP